MIPKPSFKPFEDTLITSLNSISKVPREPQSVLSPQTACSLTSRVQVPPGENYLIVNDFTSLVTYKLKTFDHYTGDISTYGQ